MTRLADEGMFVRPADRPSTISFLVTLSLSLALSVGACSVFNYPSTPFRKKEREKETGPVQRDYSNHLEDSEDERTGGRNVGHNNKPWALAR